jgi:hypothetical protein
MLTAYRFIPGLQLNEGFFFDIVKPLLDEHFPALTYSAALIGYGSDVLGLDTAISMDHNWGPRLQLFLAEHDSAELRPQVDVILHAYLPVIYQGFPTNFTEKREDFTQAMLPIETGPVNHLIEILTIPEFVQREIGLDLSQDVRPIDWLTFPEQGLIELTKGQVYHDSLGELNGVRQQFAFYPDDVWRIKMAVLWLAIGEEEAFIGRTHALGDKLGAQLITTRIVNYLMKLCFYLERQYIPYSKWFGSLFAHLNCAPGLQPLFARLLESTDLQEKESLFAEVYTLIGQMHNAIHLTEPIDFSMQNFYGRPYQVIFASRIVEQLIDSLTEVSLKGVNLALIGMEQLTDGVDMTEQKRWLRRIANNVSCHPLRIPAEYLPTTS